MVLHGVTIQNETTFKDCIEFVEQVLKFCGSRELRGGMTKNTLERRYSATLPLCKGVGGRIQLNAPPHMTGARRHRGLRQIKSPRQMLLSLRLGRCLETARIFGESRDPRACKKGHVLCPNTSQALGLLTPVETVC